LPRILTGRNLIATEPAEPSRQRFTAPGALAEFDESSPADVDAALAAADGAFQQFRRTSAEVRATFLDRIASEIDTCDELLDAAHAETALPLARLSAERGRTAGQLRMFADLIREGSWVDARIDRAIPDRQPLPKPDVRRMLIPIGPVVVFSASNFPLAFSVAGGDTASAMAAGCPVIVKAHPAHPATSELAATAIMAAMKTVGLPRGVFSLLHSTRNEIAVALVQHPQTKAVGFTGSLRAGRALFDAAARRPEPIPVYAEMGSVNPLFVLPGALAERGDAIAEGLQHSVTLGVGQFCTNPGLTIGLGDERFDRFVRGLESLMGTVPPGTMLYPALCRSYEAGRQRLSAIPGVSHTGPASAVAESKAAPAIFVASGQTFLDRPELADEVFGPSTMVIRCASRDEMDAIARRLPGQLTATIHGSAADLKECASLVSILEEKAGRLIVNGFPTGVEVCPSMQHGGPYPATTDVRSTSVGTAAIHRFARPVAYQGFPESLLPPELEDGNPRRIWRLVDGELTREGW
jgi:NADP-dependent aldehyde dehydrogenase